MRAAPGALCVVFPEGVRQSHCQSFFANVNGPGLLVKLYFWLYVAWVRLLVKLAVRGEPKVGTGLARPSGFPRRSVRGANQDRFQTRIGTKSERVPERAESVRIRILRLARMATSVTGTNFAWRDRVLAEATVRWRETGVE